MSIETKTQQNENIGKVIYNDKEYFVKKELIFGVYYTLYIFESIVKVPGFAEGNLIGECFNVEEKDIDMRIEDFLKNMEVND